MKKVLSLLAILISSTGLSYSQSKVADIEFGKTSYEEAIPKLKYKFGEPTMDDEGRIVIFSDIYYAGQNSIRHGSSSRVRQPTMSSISVGYTRVLELQRKQRNSETKSLQSLETNTK